eukprot:CAMPEP_0175823348 /NCGR_PEP_ID=MMETSP0107_2-20121207/10157_1 /TAXON_ID=195067 ORGANISM="Goniomonas pacifica, Strain CCMP1869" /NCGR_SAMPLE_ID=MMETSP0107_2 /ASSEMBLY_ACC=CAM_ASM_000203 /LENGTH=64 /DNA_ID=CAMNT_0017135861 /DNA_START=924 /DNA_END=1118 /DNA_ORIENTATION=+
MDTFEGPAVTAVERGAEIYGGLASRGLIHNLRELLGGGKLWLLTGWLPVRPSAVKPWTPGHRRD